jgi:hypothetical protein
MSRLLGRKCLQNKKKWKCLYCQILFPHVLIEDEDVVAPRPKMTPSWNHFFGTNIFGDSRKDSLLQKAKRRNI